MKVLHIGSVAGVAEMLCGKDDIVLQLKIADKFGFGQYYGKTILFDDPEELLKTALEYEFNYDRVVIHDDVEFYTEFHNPVMYWHGSKLRKMGEWDEPCIVSTPDLLQYTRLGHHLEAPVDLELFKPMAVTIEREWFCITRGYQYRQVRELIKKQYPSCDIINRAEFNVKYDKMPLVLNLVRNYVDCKYDYSKPEPKPIYSNSTTAIQAIACGCTVYTHDDKILPNTLLKVHDRKVVMVRFKKCLEALSLVKN